MKEAIATIGMFDGVHRGHRHLLETLLEESRRRGLHPVVYTFDRHPRQVLMGDASVQLLTTPEERLQLLRSMGDFELVVLPFSRAMASLSACQFYEQVLQRNHDIRALVMGYDNSFGNKQHDDFAQLDDYLRRDGVIRIDDVPVYYNDIENSELRELSIHNSNIHNSTFNIHNSKLAISSTQIRRALQAGDVSLANAMLGYRYTLTGTVTAGRHIGHALGFPTANLDCGRQAKLLPADGVYAMTARCGEASWRAVANLGAQPTVGGRQRVLEVHLLDDGPQLYGKQLQVAFVSRLRDIRTFDSPEALSAQIQQDIEQCKSLF